MCDTPIARIYSTAFTFIILPWKCCLMLSSRCSCCCGKYTCIKSSSTAAAAVVFRHRLPGDALVFSRCCVFFAPDSSVYFPLFKHYRCECTPWQSCSTYSLDVTVILYSYYMLCIFQKYRHSRETRQAAARRGGAPLVSCTIHQDGTTRHQV